MDKVNEAPTDETCVNCGKAIHQSSGPSGDTWYHRGAGVSCEPTFAFPAGTQADWQTETNQDAMERLTAIPLVADWQSNERQEMLGALERAQQSRNALRNALSEAVNTIFSGRLVSVGSLKNVYAAQVYVKDVVRWHGALATAPEPTPPLSLVGDSAFRLQKKSSKQ